MRHRDFDRRVQYKQILPFVYIVWSNDNVMETELYLKHLFYNIWKNWIINIFSIIEHLFLLQQMLEEPFHPSNFLHLQGITCRTDGRPTARPIHFGPNIFGQSISSNPNLT